MPRKYNSDVRIKEKESLKILSNYKIKLYCNIQKNPNKPRHAEANSMFTNHITYPLKRKSRKDF